MRSWFASEISFAHNRAVAWLGFSQDARTCACAQSSAYVSDNTATRPVQPPLGQLERALIEEFVRTRGYDPSRLGELADQEREKLLSEASIYER